MFCSKCGKELNADAKFCKYCGATIAEEQSSFNAPAEQYNAQYSKPKKSKTLPLVIVGIAVVALVICWAAGSFSGNTRSSAPPTARQVQEDFLKYDQEFIYYWNYFTPTYFTLSSFEILDTKTTDTSAKYVVRVNGKNSSTRAWTWSDINDMELTITYGKYKEGWKITNIAQYK